MTRPVKIAACVAAAFALIATAFVVVAVSRKKPEVAVRAVPANENSVRTVVKERPPLLESDYRKADGEPSGILVVGSTEYCYFGGKLMYYDPLMRAWRYVK